MTTKLPFLLLACVACAPQRVVRQTALLEGVGSVRIDTTAIRGYTRFLADDDLAGRATGSPGGDIAAVYIAAACTGLGLAPVGGTYFQNVALEEASISTDGTEFTVTGSAGVRAFAYPRSFLPNAGLAPPAGFAGPAMYGATSDDLLAGGLVLSGAVAVVGGALARDDDDSLKARGAVGLVQLVLDKGQYLLYMRSRGDSRLRLADSSIARSFSSSLPSIVAGPDLSRRLLNGLPISSKATALPDSVAVRVAFDGRPLNARNVACLLPGTDPRLKDTAVVYTAHYDHLGVGIPDDRGDSIYNGFSDNAAGVAMLLSIAQAFSVRGNRPLHSVLFLFFTGEEQGLLGSDYHVARPLWPLARIKGVINLDAGAPPGRPWNWRLAGGDRTALGTLARDVAAEHGWSATTSPATPNSDYFPFARLGVPAVFIVPGNGPYQGLTADSSLALRRRWDHYHDPADEWAADFPFAGLGRYAEYAFYIGRAMDLGKRERSAEPRPDAPQSPH